MPKNKKNAKKRTKICVCQKNVVILQRGRVGDFTFMTLKTFETFKTVYIDD